MSLVLSEGTRLRSGRYELERQIGRGAHAVVWLARDMRLERPVAVKVLAEGLVEDRDWLARFRREARIAARLQHPNLVSIYDLDADVDRPYLVMAYLPGGSLADRIEAGGRPDPERVAADLLSALAHIHAAGIIHRDVKPANVLLDREGRACLTDFGIARPQDATAITQTGQIPGTARYMAPELWRGEPASERSDLFAAGVLLSQYLGDDVPAGLAGLTERLSAEDPDLRPASAQAVLDLLGEPQTPTALLQGEEPEEAPSTAEVEPAPAPTPLLDGAGTLDARRTSPTRARWIPALALGLVALIVGFAVAGVLGGDDETPAPSEPRAEREAEGGAGNDAGRNDGEGGQQGSPSEQNASQAQAPVGADGYALNDEGFALIQEGRYDEAIPVLQQSVDALEGSGDITYAFALYNLGNALRLAGRPAEAIPYLKQRLKIPNQTETVKAELKQAKADLKERE